MFPALNIEKIWDKCVTSFKKFLHDNSKEVAGTSKNALPDYFENMKRFMLPHIGHREQLSNVPTNKKIAGNKNGSGAKSASGKKTTKKGPSKTPALDEFAKQKIANDNAMISAFNCMKDTFQQIQEASTNPTVKVPDSNAFVIIVDKLSKVKEELLDKCFNEVQKKLEEGDKWE